MNSTNEIQVSKMSLLELHERKRNLISKLISRCVDIVAAIIGIVMLIPLWLYVSIEHIKNKDESPVFYSQKRIGKNGKIFKMYKFRSMVHNAEELLEDLQKMNEMSGPVFKIKEDPRITRVGKFIRKTSLDELPQIINILNGDMSFVGPRPPLVNEVKQYNEYQIQRLLVKPGLTCIWQVSGRNNIDFDEWIELDLKYIKERNLMLDLTLILKTIPALLGDENAS